MQNLVGSKYSCSVLCGIRCTDETTLLLEPPEPRAMTCDTKPPGCFQKPTKGVPICFPSHRGTPSHHPNFRDFPLKPSLPFVNNCKYVKGWLTFQLQGSSCTWPLVPSEMVILRWVYQISDTYPYVYICLYSYDEISPGGKNHFVLVATICPFGHSISAFSLGFPWFPVVFSRL